MSADYLSADYSCIMVNYVKGSKAVGDSHHRTVVKRLSRNLISVKTMRQCRLKIWYNAVALRCA